MRSRPLQGGLFCNTQSMTKPPPGQIVCRVEIVFDTYSSRTGSTKIMPPKDSKNKTESAKGSTTPKVPKVTVKSKDERKPLLKTSIPQSIVMVVIAFLGGILTPPLRQILRHQPEDVDIRFVKYSVRGLAIIIRLSTLTFFFYSARVLGPQRFFFLCSFALPTTKTHALHLFKPVQLSSRSTRIRPSRCLRRADVLGK